MTTVEQRRQTLLQEMGIRCWFPRAALPGARASHARPAPAAAPEAPEAPGVPSTREAATNPGLAPQTPAELAVILPRAVTEVLPEPVAAIPDQVSEQPAAAGPDEEASPDFAFSWFNINRRLAVLAMLPPGADRLNASCRSMLQRILGALDPELKDVSLQEHTFHWPFPDDLGLPSGKIAARHAVDGFVARRLREQSSATLLVLADETPPLLFHKIRSTDAGDRSDMPEHPQFGFAMLHTHSLHAMQANAELKRSAWQAMQLIIDRLGSNSD